MAIERREWRGNTPSEGDEGSFSGRAIPFDTETQIGPASWGWKEKFNRNAFNKTLKDGDTVWLDQHDSTKPVARTSAGTLTLTKRNGGLEWDSVPTSRASWVADVIENIRAGNYGGCSVGFEVVREAWTDDDGKPSDQWDGTNREVLEAKLPEFSTVTFPAYGDTNVQQNAAERDNALLAARRERFEAAEERGTVKSLDVVNGKYGSDPAKGDDADDETQPDDGVAHLDPVNAKFSKDPKGKKKGNNQDQEGSYDDSGDDPSSPDEIAYGDRSVCPHCGAERRDQETSAPADEASDEQRSEPDSSTHEDEEYETALRMARFHETGDLLSRMSDL